MKLLPAFILAISFLSAAEFHLAPDGLPTNEGTPESPWDIASAWSGQHPIPPGSTLLMRGGSYRHPDRTWNSPGFTITLAGEEGSPITIRPYLRERVTIDSKVEVTSSARHLCLRDLEITISETATWNRRVTSGGLGINGPIDLPQGGLNILGGSDSLFLNLIIHTMTNGVGLWRPATNTTLSGCLIYNIGSIGPDRYHGPGIYTQNDTGTKNLTHNILFGNYSTTIQAYGSKNASVNGFIIDNNISFFPIKEGARQHFLIGGGQPSRDIVVTRNTLFETPLQIGYTAPFNHNAIVTHNLLIDSPLSINNYRHVEQAGNLSLKTIATSDSKITIHPLPHEPGRLHLAAYNPCREATVTLDLKHHLPLKTSYRIHSALDVFGLPLLTGQHDGREIQLPVPVEPRSAMGSFCAYVLIPKAHP